MATQYADDTSQAAIFARLWEAEEGHVPAELALEILKLRFSPQDEDRMHELAEKNRHGTITPAELETLDNYIKIGDLLALLQSKARQSLKRGDVESHG
jgi:hypothetical protein